MGRIASSVPHRARLVRTGRGAFTPRAICLAFLHGVSSLGRHRLAPMTPIHLLVALLCGLLTFGASPPAVAAPSDPADAPVLLASLNLSVNRRIVYDGEARRRDPAVPWASPDELRERGSGDCVDYAMAKYFSLVAAGLPPAQLRIAYVEAQAGGPDGHPQRHMVLAWLPADDADGDPLILDNLLDAVRPLSRRPDLRVLISFNTEGIWSGLQRGQPARDARRITAWARVLDRMAAYSLDSTRTVTGSR
jgi:predicted transglutaminase-like cysteine proteinase